MMKDNMWFNIRFVSGERLKQVSESPTPYITKDGEISEGLIAKKATYDSAPFIKLFKGSSVLRSTLTSAGGRMFDLVLFVLETQRDTSIITISMNSLDDFIEAGRKIDPNFNISRATMNRGINELIEKGVILKLRPNEYQINPRLFFNGDRIKALAKESKKWEK
ncbi:MAG: hypothetical protein ACRC9P_09470 [Bacteroides sp.]